MGNYFINRDVLEDALLIDHDDGQSAHDFGRNIIPRLLREGKKIYIYDFAQNVIPGEPDRQAPYWRDVGTIDSYFTANMELRARMPALNVYNRQWPIRAAQRHYPPARFVRPSEDAPEVEVIDSMVCEGSIVSSATVSETLLGYDCFVHQGSVIEYSVILSGCDIGARAKLRRVLFDKNCKVDPGAEIGIDPVKDRERFPFITESGIVVLPKGTHVPAEGPVQFAFDIEEMLHKDPALVESMERIAGNYTISDGERHSFQSAGPRFRRYAGVDDPT
jgi:glucose-1-phosphate adenylyltransferase